MRTVRDGEGERYLLVEQSEGSSLVRDPETGAERRLPTADLTVEAGATDADAVPPSLRRVLAATPDDRALSVLLELVDRGPLAVRTLLDDVGCCESDLHGVIAEFRAAGLVAETAVAGERGYEATDAAREGVARLREGGG